MTRQLRDHVYAGRLIRPCALLDSNINHNGRWFVQIYQISGMQWGDGICPHYPTLTTAREAIDGSLRVQRGSTPEEADRQAALAAREQEADDERYGRAVEARRDDFDNQREETPTGS